MRGLRELHGRGSYRQNAKPDEVGDGQIERERSHELRQRMREALLMRWDTVETNLLTDVQKQMGVCVTYWTRFNRRISWSLPEKIPR